MSRDELRQRQELVLGALLRGEVPDGFDPRSARLTVRVLRTKRRSDALEAVPALAEVVAAAFPTTLHEPVRAGAPWVLDVGDALSKDVGVHRLSG